MSRDSFQGYDRGADPSYAQRSEHIIRELSGLVPWNGSDQEFETGVRNLIDEVRTRPTLTERAQVVGAFRWWSQQPFGNRAWHARVTKVIERLSREFLESYV